MASLASAVSQLSGDPELSSLAEATGAFNDGDDGEAEISFEALMKENDMEPKMLLEPLSYDSGAISMEDHDMQRCQPLLYQNELYESSPSAMNARIANGETNQGQHGPINKLAESGRVPSSMSSEPGTSKNGDTATGDVHVERPKPSTNEEELRESTLSAEGQEIYNVAMEDPDGQNLQSTTNVEVLPEISTSTLGVNTTPWHAEQGPDEPVIELLDSDDDSGNGSNDTGDLIYEAFGSTSRKRRKSPTVDGASAAKRPISASEASYLARSQNMPGWMHQSNAFVMNNQLSSNPAAHDALQNVQRPSMKFGMAQLQQQFSFTEPIYLPPNPGYIPTWKAIQVFEAAVSKPLQHRSSVKHYLLSLLNVSEFTVSGVSSQFGYEPTSLSGLRVHIKSISRDHGKAVFERDAETGEGKWRIPLGAYRGFYSFLSAQPNTAVIGIDEIQLKIASLGKARLEKNYPSENKLVAWGVPENIAHTLAPFQRGGVEFVYEKGGRALIADEMGLGKTIQGIASMSIYHEEWPVLVLCPSGARYHWQNEFVNWLGIQKQPVFKLPTGSTDEDGDKGGDFNYAKCKPCMEPLIQSQVHVLTCGKEKVIPDRDTMVVICSYGLAPSMIKNKRIFPGQFKCVIVDESHMLKNKKSQRTQRLLPVLQATSRCVLLSGTPAFARPMELWPQLLILGTKNNGWDIEEDEFTQKYVKGGTKQRRAELHTMLSGTIMIRRMKNDILKSLPPKVREQAIVGVINEAQRKEFQQCIEILREGKGALGKIALSIPNFHESDQAPAEANSSALAAVSASQLITPEDQATSDMQDMYNKGTTAIHEALAGQSREVDASSIQSILAEQDQNLQEECRAYYAKRLEQLRAESAAAPSQTEVPSRKSVLMHMFKMTGQVKIPLIVEMLKKWIDDPAKGKLCLFAHHISVLNEIEKLTGLSNAAKSKSQYIRIDGSTGAKLRQEQINSFQKNPKVRVALLGITAAGVAVTLTASSTVWFAELFWTPALMIQAEDRCHRIGQQARVRCLYIVAKGTLDEILWKHVEKKFQTLGEFVEGKEKMKMVVHKTYKGTEEWRKSLERTTEEEDEEDFDDGDENKFFIDDEGVEEGIIDEIHQLEEEEQAMLRSSEADDDDFEGEAKAPAPAQRQQKVPIVGSSEADAICLSDDEDGTVGASGAQQQTNEASIKDLLLSQSFPSLRLYKMHFSGENYGLDIIAYIDRIVVRGQSQRRMEKFGHRAKPSIGDILVACNNKYLPYGWPLNNALAFLASTLRSSREPVELTFAEDAGFAQFFASTLPPPQAENGPPPVPNPSAIDFDSMLRDAQDLDRDFHGPSVGLRLKSVNEFIVVTKVSQSLGYGDVPRVGDILLAVNGQFFPRGTPLQDAMSTVCKKIQSPPATITFRRSENFWNYFMTKSQRSREQKVEYNQLRQQSTYQQQQPNGDVDAGVIDVLD